MPHNRFFIESSFTQDQELIIEGEEFDHIRVMRPSLKDKIELINGHGDLAICSIINIDKKSTLVRIKKIHHESPLSYEIILAQAIPRSSRLDTILEKGTELGATAFWLFPGENSEKIDFKVTQQERMKKLLISSSKQCGRLYFPKIIYSPPIKDWVSLEGSIFYGAFEANLPSFASVLKSSINKIIFVTGPESGLTKKEEDCLKQLKAQAVSLHRNILRTDTASIAALTLISHLLVQ